MGLSLVGAMGLARVGAMGLTPVGAIALAMVGAMGLTRVSAWCEGAGSAIPGSGERGSNCVLSTRSGRFSRKFRWRGACSSGGMATHYTELIAWQLADDIRRHVFRWTGRPPFSADFKRKAQVEDAADSVCRNVSEGFPGTHAQFANYLEIAIRSLNEVMDCTRSAQLKGYITADEAAAVRALSRRLYPALTRLVVYLRRTPDPTHPRSRAQQPRERTDKR